MVPELMSETEPPPSRIGCSVDDCYATLADLDVCGIASIGAKREGKPQQPQVLRNRLKVQQRTLWPPCSGAYVSGKVLGILEAARRLACRGPVNGRQQVETLEEGHVSRRQLQGAVKGTGEPAYDWIAPSTDNRYRGLDEEPVDCP